jgi:hypothetical protein
MTSVSVVVELIAALTSILMLVVTRLLDYYLPPRGSAGHSPVPIPPPVPTLPETLPAVPEVPPHE